VPALREREKDRIAARQLEGPERNWRAECELVRHKMASVPGGCTQTANNRTRRLQIGPNGMPAAGPLGASPPGRRVRGAPPTLVKLPAAMWRRQWGGHAMNRLRVRYHVPRASREGAKRGETPLALLDRRQRLKLGHGDS
jgi:hypothetical protein